LKDKLVLPLPTDIDVDEAGLMGQELDCLLSGLSLSMSSHGFGLRISSEVDPLLLGGGGVVFTIPARLFEEYFALRMIPETP